MYLSKLRLSSIDMLRNRIYGEYDVHRFVYRLFPGIDKRDFLYRVEYGTAGSISIIIQSAEKPQSASARIETKEIPASFYGHDRYLFSLRINPVKRKEDKVVRVISDEAEISQWLCSLGNPNGIRFRPESFQLMGKGVVRMRKGGNAITLSYCDVIGVLEVSDRDLFTAAALHGIGRSKGFGFGMLLLKPLKEDI